MGSQLRVYRRRIKSVQSTKKITKAMELIAASRIVRAQNAIDRATPYTRELTRAISIAASRLSGSVSHPLTEDPTDKRRAAVLLVGSDRGLAGAYSANVIKDGEQLTARLKDRGVEVVPYLVGRKVAGFYSFRQREVGQEWTGFSEAPDYAHAKEIADTLLERFLQPSDMDGFDEIHLVYTQFVSTVTQRTVVRRILPLEFVDDPDETSKPGRGGPEEGGPFEDGSHASDDGPTAQYTFEPDPESVLDALLPRYIENVVYTALLSAAASEHAARRRAMKSASDNATELIKTLTRQANQARQAEITQEISEIVGGADALADSAGRG
jgi:F-type H+-transporting ATPase subunit gamma